MNKPSLDALRVANVKYIISMLPLVDSELRLITGPEISLLPPRALAQWGDYSWLIEPGYFRVYFENKNAYVYELRGTVPMVYSPKGIVKTVFGKSDHLSIGPKTGLLHTSLPIAFSLSSRNPITLYFF